MTLFRPCIDLHAGKVKQIVGGSLTEQGATTNFESEQGSDFFANLYKESGLSGGHVIGLGPGNEQQAKLALATWPGGLQYGGGINPDNASDYLNAGASHVIVTSYLFVDNQFSWPRLAALQAQVGREQLVLDLSCRRTEAGWNIATNRWQTVTSTQITAETLARLAATCSEFLVHAADVEGLQGGMDTELIEFLGEHCPIPVTYAGGARNQEDLQMVHKLSQGRVDITIGSALDIFGGNGITLDECIAWNRSQGQAASGH
ncbi:phosphoribosylformimino-5-aminoimidazole carboxamide ribotide isomerase [Halioxenophilus sp. WMMB6]|uniref:phosphoribosylformimino-5-aminoimidazole carboxamide ribotide isomerase n=1 Tax=Halioxenophilus sp. WMMB6 TaxID=3073815 RepID=UPI00295EC4EF|nr:phosphoribosylformimino-5-aminoimidazole carboxamide ribotide isomerase [Halioxenophilus sp. WMMB6]